MSELAELIPEYTFSYDIEIKSKDRITFLGAPDEALKHKTKLGMKIVTQKDNNIPSREIKIYFKTVNMFEPQLKYQIDPKTNEVACLASFVPTFSPNEPQDKLEILSDAPE